MTDAKNSPEREAAELAKLAAEISAVKSLTAFQKAQARHELELAQVAHFDAIRSEICTRDAALSSDEKHRDHQTKLATDAFNNIYRFTGEVSSHSVKQAIDLLTIWDRLDSSCAIELVFNSPGGEVISGMDLYDFIQELRRKGHRITTATRGYAASMGGILLQAGDTRVMGEEAVVLIHEISTGAFGKVGEIEDEVELIHKLQDRVLNIFARRSAEAFDNGTSEIALNREQLEHGDRTLGIPGWSRKDWWLTSDECLKYGIVDSVR